MRAARAGDPPAARPGPVSRTTPAPPMLAWRQKGDRPPRPHVPAAPAHSGAAAGHRERPPDTPTGRWTTDQTPDTPTRGRQPATAGDGRGPDQRNRTAAGQPDGSATDSRHLQSSRSLPYPPPQTTRATSSALRQWTPRAPADTADTTGRTPRTATRGQWTLRTSGAGCGSGGPGDPSDPSPLRGHGQGPVAAGWQPGPASRYERSRKTAGGGPRRSAELDLRRSRTSASRPAAYGDERRYSMQLSDRARAGPIGSAPTPRTSPLTAARSGGQQGRRAGRRSAPAATDAERVSRPSGRAGRDPDAAAAPAGPCRGWACLVAHPHALKRQGGASRRCPLCQPRRRGDG